MKHFKRNRKEGIEVTEVEVTQIKALVGFSEILTNFDQTGYSFSTEKALMGHCGAFFEVIRSNTTRAFEVIF